LEFETFKNILDRHQKWLDGINGGKIADFSGQNLSTETFFKDADLRGADFLHSNLKCTNFIGANLQNADFNHANLYMAILINTDLRGADFSGANLFGAFLSGANLENVTVDYDTQGYFLACPSHGAFTAFKKLGGYIVVLEIPADAQRSSATTYKCRCDKAKVLRIENLDGTPADVDSVASNYGETVSVENFDENRWNECSTGIHFFIDRNLAVLY